MADFSHLSNFDPNANFSMVRWSANSPMLEVELNEMQQILDMARADLVRQSIPSGVSTYTPIPSTNLGFYVSPSGQGEGAVGTASPGQPNTNVFTVADFSSFVNGYKVRVSSSTSGLSSAGSRTAIQLDPPPTFGTRDDLVFLEVWFQEVGGANNSTGADTNVYTYGGVNSGNDTNNILDSRINVETTHRVQLRWRIRVVDGVNFSKFPEGLPVTYQDGYNNNTNTMPQGGNSSPINSGANYPYYYSFSKSSDTTNYGNNKFNYTIANDVGLYIAGNGSSSCQTTFNTFDGYVYAIPLFRVKRRNNGGYRIDNPNGARDFYQLTCTATSTTITTVGQIYTLKVSDTSKVQVGDSFAWTVTFNSRFKVIQVVDSTTLTVQAISINSAVGDTQVSGYVFNMLSDRPDGLFSNIIDASDIIDLRHQVSLTGFDRQMLLKSSFDKLMRAELQTNVKYTLQKEKYNLKRAPFGIAQALQPINVQGNDGVTRSLVNLLGTQNSWKSTSFWGVSGTTLSLDSSNAEIGNNALKASTNGGNSGSIYNTNIPVVSGNYYLAIADVKVGNASSLQIAFGGSVGTSSTSSSYSTVYKAYLATATGNNTLAVYVNGTASGQYGYIDGVRLYQIDQATYNAINGATTGFATASDIANKFPYVDSYPNFAENLLPDFTNSNWTIPGAFVVNSPYQITLNATATWQSALFSVPVQPNTTYQVSSIVATPNSSGITGSFLDANKNNIGSVNSGAWINNSSFTTPSNCAYVQIAVGNGGSSSGTYVFSNIQLEKVNTGISYPNPFVPTGRWFLQQDQFNPQLGGQQTILHNQNTLGGAFNGLRSNFSNAQISQTVVDVVESNGYSAQKHIVATQATKGQWTANDTVKINNYYGVLDGVYASGDISRIVAQGTPIDSQHFTLDDVSKFSVNDTVLFYDPTMGTARGSSVTITAIDTTNKIITVNAQITGNDGDVVVLTTASKTSPTVVDSAGNTIAGTWSGLGTKTATFTVTTPPATNTSNLTITYSVSYPTGQGFNYLPLQSSDVLQASVNGDVLHSANTISVKANFNGKVSGNTDLNPHFSGAATNSASLLVPSSFGEATASVYPLLSQLDGSSYSFSSSTSGNYAQALYKFNLIRAIEDKFGEIPADGTANKITWIKNNINMISGVWTGYGSGPNGNKSYLKFWNNNSNSWDSNYSGSNTSSSPSSLTLNLATGNYPIDSNGMVNLLAYADPAGAVANPTVAPTLSASGSGSGLTAGTYYVTYTWVTPNGESLASTEASITITAGQNIVVTVPSLPFGCTNANVYIANTSGSETRQGNTNGGTTFTQNVALLTGTNSAPTFNTAVVSSTVYTDYVELQITLNTAETGFTVLQPDNPFPSLSANLLDRNQAFPIDTNRFNTYGGVTLSTPSVGVINATMNTGQTNALGGIYVGVNLPANQPYTLSTTVKAPAGETIELQYYNGASSHNKLFTATGNWQTISYSFTDSATITNLYVALTNGNAGDVLSITNLKVEQGANPNPTWTPGRNKNFTMNFLGKVAGSTAENPNKYYRYAGGTGQIWTPNMGTFIENASSDYSNISLLDGTLSAYSTLTSGNQSQHIFEFDLSHLGMSLTELKNALRSMTVNWTGYGSGDSTYVPAPTTAPTLSTATTGGNLAPGTYYVVYTWKTASGETMASPEQSIVVPSGTSTNTITVNIPGLPTNVTSANIYISTTSGAEKLQGNTATSSYTQTAVLATATALPTSNTTGGTLTNGATASFWRSELATSSPSIWSGVGSNTSSSPSNVSYTTSNNGTSNDIKNFVTGSQKVYVLVYSTYPASASNPSNIYTDYINLQVQLADYVDYAKSNIVKVRPSTMEIKTLFPAKSNRYTGGSGIAQEDVLDLWYKHVPVYSALPSNGGTNVTVLAESDDWLVSDIGSNMGAIQGTHPYQNPLYRVGNDRMTTFAQYGFARVSWQEDSREINTGAQTSLYLNGVYAYGTVQSALNVVSKPLVAIARWLVLTPSGELQLAVLSTYATNGAIGTVGNLGTVVLLIPIQGRPLVKDPQGIQRGYMNPKTWLTKESTILV